MISTCQYLQIPICESHHDVERGKKKAEMKEAVAVAHPIFFIVICPVHPIFVAVDRSISAALFSLH